MKGALKLVKYRAFNDIQKGKSSLTRKTFQNGVESFMISTMGWHCMAEIAAANSYPDNVHRWRDEVERILFIDLSFFISSVTTKAAFDGRRAINEIVAEYNSAKTFQASLSIATKNLAVRYLNRPRADLKLPDVEQCRNKFWRMVSETVEFIFERLTDALALAVLRESGFQAA